MTSDSTTSPPPLRALRRQYRVGHGGFHATIVNPGRPAGERLTYVYDVGAALSVGLLEYSIDVLIDELVALGISTVDYIFISHIDTDHVNRLEYLLKRLKNLTKLPKSEEASWRSISVARVIIPWLTPLGKLLTQARCSPSKQLEMLTAVDDEVNSYLSSLGVREVIRVGGPSASPGATFQSGVSLTLGHGSGWQLIPLWLPLGDWERDMEACFLSALESKTHRIVRRGSGTYDPTDPRHHTRILRDHRRKVKEAMKAVADLHNLSHRNDITNWSSIALLAGTPDPSGPCDLGNVNRNIMAECAHFWLHTGDLPLKTTTGFLQDLDQAVHPRVKLCVLVPPHHGSEHSHDPALYPYVQGGTALITAGKYANGDYAKKINPADARASAKDESVGATPIELWNR